MFPSQVAVWYPWKLAIEYNLAIDQCWVLLLQCLLHTFQLLRVQVRSDSLAGWQQLIVTSHQIQNMILRGHRGGLVVWSTGCRSDNKCQSPLFVNDEHSIKYGSIAGPGNR